MGNKYGYNGSGGNMGGGFGGGNMQNLMKQAQQMQQKLQQAQEQLEQMQITGSASGGLVQVVVTGKKTILSVSINPSACDPDDCEMLEDLVMAAINDAYAKAQEQEDALLAPFAAMKGLL